MLTTADIKSAWQPIVAIAAWVGAGIGAFLTFPIDISATSELGQMIAGAAQTFVTIGFGILLLVVRQRSKAKGRFWLISSSIALGALVAFFFLYIVLQESWTCPYANGLKLTIGADPTPKLTAFLQSHRDRSICAALFDFVGETGEMFAFGGLLIRFIVLAATYVVAWLSLACIVVLLAAGLSRTPITPKRPS